MNGKYILNDPIMDRLYERGFRLGLPPAPPKPTKPELLPKWVDAGIEKTANFLAYIFAGIILSILGVIALALICAIPPLPASGCSFLMMLVFISLYGKKN